MRRCVRLTTLPPSCAVVMKSGNLKFLEHYGPLQAFNGTAFFLVVEHKRRVSIFSTTVVWNISHSKKNRARLLTYLLTPCSTVLLEKLTGSAASQGIPRIFGARKFINVLTSARHLSLSYLHVLSVTFLILRRIQRYTTINVNWSWCEVPIYLSNFSEIRIFCNRFPKNTQM